MILAEFLSFKKFDIEEDIINNPTSFTVDSLTQTINDSINLLRPIRPSSQRTAKVIKSIMEKHMKKREIGGHYDENNNRVPDTWIHERTIESDIFKLWLHRFSEQNLSYNNAYNALVPYFNTGNAFPVSIRQIEDPELIEFIRKDDDEEIQYVKNTRMKNNDRTKITVYTQGLQISGDAELDKNWNINKREAEDENYRRKEEAERRRVLLNELGNKIILATDETTLIEARVELLNLERININWKYSNPDELVCTDDLGNEIWLRSGETNTFEEREKEINSLKELIENKLLLLNKKNNQDKIDSAQPINSSKEGNEDHNNNHFDIDASFLIVKDPDNNDEVFKYVRYIEFPLKFKQKDGEKYSIPIYNDFCKLLFSNRLSIKQFKPKANEFTDNIQNINSSDENPSSSYFDLTYTDELRGIFENAYKIGFENANDWFNYIYTNPYIQLKNIFTRYNFEEVQEFVYDKKFINLRISDLTEMGYKSCIFSRLLDVKNSYPIEYDEFIKEKSKIKDKTDVSLPPPDDSPEKIFPTIDKSKYDPDLIFKYFNNRIFKCEKNIFEDNLVNGNCSPTKIKWLDTKRGCKAQLRGFINEITNQSVKPKPIKLMFDCEIDSDTTIGKLNIEISTLLKSCKTQKV